ncbi:general substrate transporter [Thozetella sp. PMI_491]|nr:general substrate transporter [Thozetella sp. PMI_491]
MSIIHKFRYFNRRLALSCGLIAISSFNYGFDNLAFATIQAMDQFQKQFGDYDPKTGSYFLQPYWLSLFNSLNYIGFTTGVILGSAIASKWGRKRAMFIMSVYALITATIAVTSQNKSQIMVARILNYIYVGIELAVVPTYQSELVPSQIRGLVVGTYSLSLVGGGLCIQLICYGTSTLQDNRAWRLPLCMFYIVPSIIASLVLFVIPESPRWLLRKGREDEAFENLRKLREGVFEEDKIEVEFRELCHSLNKEKNNVSIVELFRGTNLRRTLIAIMVNVLCHATGQAYSSTYGTLTIKALGIFNPFVYSCIAVSVTFFTIANVLLWSDRIGRRFFIMLSSLTLGIVMMILGVLGTIKNPSVSEKRAVMFMMGLIGAGWGAGWGPMTPIITTEISALRLRDLTSRVGFLSAVFTSFLVNFSIPYLTSPGYAGLGSKIGFIFGPIGFIAVLCAYLFVPECKGKTLEEVDLLFGSGVPLREFGKTSVDEGEDGVPRGPLCIAIERSVRPLQNPV